MAALLLHETGRKDEADDMLAKAVKVSTSELARVEAAIAKGHIHLQEAFQGFKTDLFMSSLLDACELGGMAPFVTGRLTIGSDRNATGTIGDPADRSAVCPAEDGDRSGSGGRRLPICARDRFLGRPRRSLSRGQTQHRVAPGATDELTVRLQRCDATRSGSAR